MEYALHAVRTSLRAQQQAVAANGAAMATIQLALRLVSGLPFLRRMLLQGMAAE